MKIINNQKGITIVSLVVTIIILVILASVTVSVGGNVIDKAKLQTINTNMMLIQAKVKTIEEQAKFNKDKSNYKGTKISEITNNANIDNLKNSGVIDDIENCYLLSQDDITSMGLEKVNIELGYVVNYSTEEIIYVKGFKNEETTYYKLSDMKNLVIK